MEWKKEIMESPTVVICRNDQNDYYPVWVELGDPIRLVVDAYCRMCRCTNAGLHFLFDGEELKPWDRIGTKELGKGYLIDVRHELWEKRRWGMCCFQ